MIGEKHLHDLGETPGLETPANLLDFLRSLPGPSLWTRAGRDASRWRAVVGLIHGNEPSGLAGAIAALDKSLQPATNLLVIVASVEAALQDAPFRHRMAPGERDLNRCFTSKEGDRVSLLAAEILERLRRVRPEAVVDLHNNSGHNPAYGVGVGINRPRLALTALFADRFVESPFRLGSLMEAMANDTHIVTIECGRAGDLEADETARRGVQRYVEIEDLFAATPVANGMQLLHDPVRVMLREGWNVAFERDRFHPVDVVLDPEVDRHNFQMLEAGAHIAWSRRQEGHPFVAIDPEGRDRAAELFELRDDGVHARTPMIPIMMTTDAGIARSDCLFYCVRPLSAAELASRNI